MITDYTIDDIMRWNGYTTIYTTNGYEPPTGYIYNQNITTATAPTYAYIPITETTVTLEDLDINIQPLRKDTIKDPVVDNEEFEKYINEWSSDE